ncbi:MAG: hypothetical protein IPN85_17805 [Flavobacteriales bacterium]|nr:hypothetical protein [Flavobacteriales bacterium]
MSMTVTPMRGDTAYSDTVVGQHVLIGTTALPGTDQNMEARWVHGVSLNRVSFSPCSSGETEDMGSTLIEELIWTDSTLTVKAKVIANCGFSFLCDIEVLNDTILNLIHYGYGDQASCSCCFGLTYHITRFNDDTEAILPTCVMIGRDRTTLKKLPS